MAEYIERKVILDELQEEMKYNSSMLTKEQNQYIRYGLRIAISDIQKLPAIDVNKEDFKEVVHGKWLTDRFGLERSICSVCNAIYEGDDGNYCSECGAKMDKESKE